MQRIPEFILEEVRKAIDKKATYTEYIDAEISEELAAALKEEHLLIVRHPRFKEQFKLFVPVKFRTKRP